MPDLFVKCRDCHAEFVVTDQEMANLQERFPDRCEPPKRCKSCRAQRRVLMGSQGQEQARNSGFDVLTDEDSLRAWREGYVTIYAGSVVIQERNEFFFVQFVRELLTKGEKVRAVMKLRDAERQVEARQAENRIW